MSGTVTLKGQEAHPDQLSDFALAARLAGAQHWEDWRIARHKKIEAEKLPGNFWYHVERLLGGPSVTKGESISNAVYPLLVTAFSFTVFTALLGLAVAFIPGHVSFYGTLVEVFLIMGGITLTLWGATFGADYLSNVRVLHPASWMLLSWDITMGSDRDTNMPTAAFDVAERLSAQMPRTEYKVEKLLRPNYPGLFDPILWAYDPTTGESRAVWVWYPDGSSVDPATVT